MNIDWSLILNFVKVLAWPSVVTGALIAFRKHIATILTNIGTLKVAGVEMEIKKLDQKFEQLDADTKRRLDEVIKFFDPQLLDWRAEGRDDLIQAYEAELDRKARERSTLPVDEEKK